jgi:protein-disulfide isomerase
VNTLTVPVNHRDHRLGLSTAAFMLVQYGHYECSRGAEVHSTIQALQATLGDRLCFVYRHFPQVELYPHTLHAAEAAEAAASQSKFWEMHDCLLNHQHALDNGVLVEYAALLNLDVSRFLREMTRDVYVQRVMEDWNSGISSGVACTPTFFINGYRYDGDWDVESLRKALCSTLTIKDSFPFCRLYI